MSVPFTQTREYLKWHESVGTKTFYKEFFERKIDEGIEEDFQIEETEHLDKVVVIASIILNLGIGKVLYVPYGPYFKVAPNKDEQIKVRDYLHELAVKEGCVFVRLEDEKKYFALKDKCSLNNSKYLVRPIKKTYSSEGIFQPRMEWWLDILKSEEEILNAIHKDHRYSIRRAQKEGVETEIVGINLHEKFQDFWSLMEETSNRDGFKLYERKYYEEIFRDENKHLKKFLVFTKIGGEEKYLSVALIVIKDHIANLVFAGSVGEKRELGFNHLMQWTAILEAKKYNSEIYNFGGINENGFGKKTLAGVTSFKKKFGGHAHFHGVFLDIPVKKLRYLAYLLRKMIY